MRHFDENRSSAGLLVGLLALAGCEPAPPTPAWCAGADPAVRSVFNRVPEGGPPPLALTEAWRVGGADDETSLAGPSRPSIREDGLVAIADPMISEVVAVTASGRWLGPILAKGAGPGEVSWPVATGWAPDGALLILDLRRGAVIEYDVEARSWIGETPLPPALFSQIQRSGELPGAAFGRDGSLLLELPRAPAADLGPGRVRAALVRVTGRAEQPGGGDGRAAIDTLLEVETPVLGGRLGNWPRPGGTRPVYAGGPGGSLALAGESAVYRIRIQTAALADSLVICLDAESEPLSASERGDTTVAEGFPGELVEALREAGPLQTPLPFGAVFFGDAGRLWVLRDRSHPLTPGAAAEGGRYDVFEAGGEYAGTVRAPDRVALVGEAAGLVFGMERGAFDEMALVAYRLSMR